MVSDPEAALEDIRHAGAIFLGPNAPAVAGDYAVGTNHVLPTGGLAKSCGGLGLEAFLKPLEIVRVSRGIWKYKAVGSVDGAVAVEADLMCTIRSATDASQPAGQ